MAIQLTRQILSSIQSWSDWLDRSKDFDQNDENDLIQNLGQFTLRLCDQDLDEPLAENCIQLLSKQASRLQKPSNILQYVQQVEQFDKDAKTVDDLDKLCQKVECFRREAYQYQKYFPHNREEIRALIQAKNTISKISRFLRELKKAEQENLQNLNPILAQWPHANQYEVFQLAQLQTSMRVPQVSPKIAPPSPPPKLAVKKSPSLSLIQLITCVAILSFLSLTSLYRSHLKA